MIRSLLISSLLVGLSGCSSLFYYPAKQQFYDPAKISLKYQDVSFESSDGKKLHAWYFPAVGPSKGSFLFFHGNAENLTSHFVGLHWLPAAGYSFFIFDYPGYGKSEGDATQQSTVDAGKEALRWLAKQKREQKEKDPIYIYGQSLGGNIAMRVALEMKTEIPFRAVIVDGSFLSYRSVARSVLAKNWFTWIFQPIAYLVMSNRYAPEHLEELSPIPLFVLHGQKDPVVPLEQGQQIFSAAKEPKQMWILPQGHHGDSFFTENGIYRQKLLIELEKLQ